MVGRWGRAVRLPRLRPGFIRQRGVPVPCGLLLAVGLLLGTTPKAGAVMVCPPNCPPPSANPPPFVVVEPSALNLNTNILSNNLGDDAAFYNKYFLALQADPSNILPGSEAELYQTITDLAGAMAQVEIDKHALANASPWDYIFGGPNWAKNMELSLSIAQANVRYAQAKIKKIYPGLDTSYENIRRLDPSAFGYVTPTSSSNSNHLGMYVSSDTANLNDWGAAGGGSVSRSSGYRITDSAGTIAPGTIGPSLRDVSGNGGIYGSYDASRFFELTGNRSLILKGFFDYRQDSIALGAAPGAAPLVVGNAGSMHMDTYTFGGIADYRSGTSYLRGIADYNFGHADETNGLAGSTGSFGTSGYGFDARLGNVFLLFNTGGVPAQTALPTKAPLRPASGTIVGLDLSAHVGYFANQSDGFTDSSGFMFGTGRTEFGDVGGRAELFELVRSYGLVWKPYVAGTVDQLFGYSTSVNIPSQAALASGDVVSLQEAKTFGGAELGLNASGTGGWTVGVKGFYQASADTNIAGGSVSLKIPFNSTGASRY